MPKPLPAALLCVGLAAACPAGAGILPAELWQDWQRLAAQDGSRLTASVATGADGSLSLSAIRLSRTLFGAPAVIDLGTARMEPDGPGGVRITVPAGQSVAVGLGAPDADPLRFVIAVTGETVVMHATGTPGAVAYDITPANLAIEAAPEDAASADRIRLALPGLAGHVAPDGTADVAAAQMDLELAVADPASGQLARLTGRHDRPHLTLAAVPGGTPDRPDRQMVLTSAAATHDWQSLGPDGTVSAAQVARDLGSLVLTVGPDRFEAKSHDTAVRLTTLPPAPDLRPHGVLIDTFDLSILGPAVLTAGDVTLSLGAIVDGLSLSSEDWAAIDPRAGIARDPGSLVLDLDAVTAFAPAPRPPDQAIEGLAVEGQLRSVTIHRLSLDFLGVSLDAQGNVRFLPAPAATSPGGMRPVGRVETAATGVYGLLQSLSGAGLLTQDQALGLSMAMMIFAQPGEGDSLTSTIVAGADGSVSVNGRNVTGGMP
ncbi:MAG: hypothetical protein JNK88_07215 [Mangrovicoccus sp.]|nr:hypothetical protein [Mangrovicoccus sp.]